MFRKVIALFVVGVLFLMITIPTTAQNGDPSRQAEELVTRAFRAIERVQGYQSYILTGNTTLEMTMDMTYLFEGGSATLWEQMDQTVVFIQLPRGQNIQSDITVTYLEDFNIPGEETLLDYTVQAEVRYVDEQLYVNAFYIEAEGDMPNLPAGWVAVDNYWEYPLYDNLGLAEFPVVTASTTTILDADLLTMAAYISDAILRRGTLEDGTPVDYITMTFGPDAFRDLINEALQDAEDTLTEVYDAIVEVLDKSDYIVIEVGLDADDVLRWIRLAANADLDEAEMQIIFEALEEEGLSAEGIDMSMWVHIDVWTTYDQINAILEPVDAPLE